MLARSRNVSVKVLYTGHLWTRKFQSLHFSVECVNLVQEFQVWIQSKVPFEDVSASNVTEHQ